MRKILHAILVCLLFLSLVSCSPSNKYTITFDADGGTEISSITVEKDKEVELPVNTTKTGYKFNGWMDNTGRIVATTLTVSDNIALKASWISIEDETITVSFDSDGGTKVADLNVIKGEALKLPEPPSKEGYTFRCWVDKNEVPIYDEALLSEDIALKAIWENPSAKTITITFNTNGGTPVAPITIQSGQALTLPAPPTKQGYIFRVWMDQNETPVYDGVLLAESTTLTAFWDNASTDTFRITFDCNGGSKVADILVVKGETLALPDQPFRNGYTFQTWVDQNETPIYDGALLDSDVNLKAVWIKN